MIPINKKYMIMKNANGELIWGCCCGLLTRLKLDVVIVFAYLFFLARGLWLESNVEYLTADFVVLTTLTSGGLIEVTIVFVSLKMEKR